MDDGWPRCCEQRPALCERAELEDFDLSYAHEALARAHGVAGNEKERDRYRKLARDAVERIIDADDREHFLADLLTLR